MGDAGNGLISGTAADDDGEICGGAAVVPGGDLDACGFTDGVVEWIRDGGHTTALRRSGLGQPLGGTPRDVPSGEHLAESRWGGGRFGGEVFVWGGLGGCCRPGEAKMHWRSKCRSAANGKPAIVNSAAVRQHVRNSRVATITPQFGENKYVNLSLQHQLQSVVCLECPCADSPREALVFSCKPSSRTNSPEYP